MRTWHAPYLLLVLFACGLLLGTSRAQDHAAPADALFSNYRHFRIPFSAGPGKARLKQLQLFFSTDQGRTWQPAAIAAPDQEFFRFICDRDGQYWFTVQTLDQDNRYFPPSMDAAQPSLKVIVDTQPPTVQLRPLAARGQEVGVAWDVRDEHLDARQPDSLRLEYRAAGAPNWTMLPVNPLAGQHYWDPQINGQLEVRAKARDRAGNVAEAATNVGPGVGGAEPFPNAGGHEAAGPLPAGFANATNKRLVNNRRVSLNYELEKVGPSGVASIELWFTQDGRSWNRFPLHKEESGPAPKPLVFEVNGEGIYGFTLVAKSGVGLGERPPQVGDPPQVWVEVDLTKPAVQLLGVLVGQGAEKGKLSVGWVARDKNLGRDPITLSYAEQQTGPWTAMAGKLPNSGRYVWTMPEPVPYQFYVRVEAADLAGNVGEAVTTELVKVDLAQPKVKILNVEPAGK